MLLLKAFAVWLIIIAVETVHGILRGLFLAPIFGDFRARQIGVFIGSLLILATAYLFIRWIQAETLKSLLAVGLIWLILTLFFELTLGFLILRLDSERIVSDYNVLRGGLLPIGLVLLFFSPLIAAKLRKLRIN